MPEPFDQRAVPEGGSGTVPDKASIAGPRVESLTEADLSAVVSIHLRAFPGFFLSFLGPRFLREFYASFLCDPVGMGFVVRDTSGTVLGAVVGPLDPRGYFGRLLKRRWWAFGWAAVGAVMRRPSSAARLVRGVFYRGEAPSGPQRALLSSIAVAPEAQGRGVGRMLAERWTAEARRRGAPGAYLTTDRVGNDAVNGFYRGLGWQLECSYTTPEGRAMNRYVLDFDRAA